MTMTHAQQGPSAAWLADAWTAAYQDYSKLYALEHRASTPDVRVQLGYAAERVSQAWRALVGAQVLPWWITAAVELAALEFEDQARELFDDVRPVTATAVRVPSPVRRSLPSSASEGA
ncbi:hypothetical protein ACQPXB_41275 [Amycolatopsis sp. CA-161197]|uniref:hypothetical protein n=1 Tax=Amycolatopsis sp. CA-161197 TaxID=3239922 RepID=UPI003D8B852E